MARRKRYSAEFKHSLLFFLTGRAMLARSSMDG